MTDNKKSSESKDYLSMARKKYKEGLRPSARALEKATQEWKRSKIPKA
ncbi:hypothetical protein KAW50_02585 [candidate division WOR-3 bacterium]|nr:hypothetical protein [candidate division WOR-3 bacterium]